MILMHFKVLYFKNKENVNLRQQSIATVTLSGDTERPPSLLRWTVSKKHAKTARCRQSGLKTTCELLQPVTLFFPTSKTAPLREAKTAPRGPAEGPSSCPRHLLPSLCTVPIPAPSGEQAMRSPEVSSVQYVACAGAAVPHMRWPCLQLSPCDFPSRC